nr:hypothetical protein [Tanacetum cinerariifolium]
GGVRGEIGKSEAVPFQRRPSSPSPKIKEITADQPKDRMDITSLVSIIFLNIELFMGREMPLILRQQPLLSHSYPHRIESEMVHDEMFIPENRILTMAETYDVAGVGRGGVRGEIGKSEAVP